MPYPNGAFPNSALIPGYDLVANNAGYAWLDMVIAAAGDGVTITIVDGYRDLGTQQHLYDTLGAWSDTNPGAAVPGTSDHGWGTAVDVSRTPQAMAWLGENARRFGWSATISNEPWHFEYQGANPMAMEGEAGFTGSGGSGEDQGVGGAQPGPGEDTYPRGAQLFRTENGTFVLRYQIRPRVFIEYSVSDVRSLRNSGYRTREAEEYTGVRERQFLVGYRQAGDAAELAELPAGKSLRALINETIDEYFPPWHPGRKDPELVAIMARIVASPGVEAATIQAWIQQTEYGAKITEDRSTWMNANPAVRKEMIEEQAAQIQDIWWQLTGERIDFDDPRLQQWSRRVASGRMTITEVGRQIEGAAKENPDSPYARATRDELIEQGAFEAGVENTTGDLRTLSAQWGIQMTPESLARWSRNINMNSQTREDFMEYLKDTAAVLYPGKTSRDTSTIDYANPWLSTLSRVLETGTPDLNDPRVQQALQNNTTVHEFERQLMQEPEWMGTKNAKTTYDNTFGDLARQMGFA